MKDYTDKYTGKLWRWLLDENNSDGFLTELQTIARDHGADKEKATEEIGNRLDHYIHTESLILCDSECYDLLTDLLETAIQEWIDYEWIAKKIVSNTLNQN